MCGDVGYTLSGNKYLTVIAQRLQKVTVARDMRCERVGSRRPKCGIQDIWREEVHLAEPRGLLEGRQKGAQWEVLVTILRIGLRNVDHFPNWDHI